MEKEHMSSHRDFTEAFVSTAAENQHAGFKNLNNDLPPELLQLALTSAETALYHWNLESGHLSFSDNIEEVFPFGGGVPQHESEWLALVHEEDRSRVLEQKERWHGSLTQTTNERYRLVQGGETVWIRQSGVALQSGKLVVGVIYFHCRPPQQAMDGMRVASVKMPGHASRTTDYVYPEEFVSQLQSVMDSTTARKQQGALLILSVANFGMIINAYGHQASEVVAREIAGEIRKLLCSDDKLYRIHRDQFAIVLADCTPDEIDRRATQISNLIHNYGQNASVGDLHAICAIGSMHFPAESADATDIIDKAYIALHRTNGTIHRSYSAGPDEKMIARQQMGLANYLRKAIQENKLRLAYQPVIASKSGEVSYYEALLRMIGEDGKISSAGALIPVAERMGLIDMVDHLVLDMVVRELEQSPQVTLAFNVSNLTTENPHWLNHFKSLMQGRPEIASRLVVEITETAAHRDLRRTAYFVASVQETGAQVALDDFGSGYTSFRQLKALSVDIVKIDGAFIKDLTGSADNRFFVKTLLEFTECFGLKSVAEFVENGETAKLLMELGVDFLQGYYFGKPENYRSWLAEGEYRKT